MKSNSRLIFIVDDDPDDRQIILDAFLEKNPQIETLVKIAAATGLEFAIDIAPVGHEPKLVGKAVKDTPAHVYGGASLLVAGA